ncbi:retrovirus-related pol polyprotein from transposon TNT 1-94 [Tanacetum coccineum]|uniref:Retrovirus-related pol polyprotein from transposon TNT 1-94 n=1 Tax=Tanacetum coccineum TaxID=301880 RepID=A0ABQ5F794_9ASTR
MQADRVNIQSRNSGNDGRNTRRSYVQEEIIEGNNVQNDVGNTQRTLRTTSSGSAANVQCYNCSEKGHYARNCPKPKVQDSKYFMEQMLLAKQDEAGVTLTDEQNDFLVADATRMEEIEELTSYELEKLARNAYKEAEKQQINAKKVKQQNKVLTQQLELYKEKVWVFEMTKGDNATFLNEFIEADSKARHLERDLQTQFIHDRDIIQDLEQKQDNLQLSIVELKRQIVELQKTQTILKRKMSENEDKYHDTVLYLEAKAKENENVVLKIGRSLQAMFMLGPKPLDTEDILDDATKSQKKMDNKFKDPIAIKKKQNVRIIDYNKLNALYEDFVPQKELSAEQKYFSSTLYLLKILQMRVKPILHELHLNFEIFQKRFSEDIKVMKDVFDSTESALSATWKQNELLNDQLLEAKIKHEIECCVLLSHECVNNNVQDEIEKIQRDSIEI